MTRVASVPLQRTMADAIQRSQQKLAIAQAQLSTGKKAPDLASLGTEAVRNLSARTLVAKEEAHTLVAGKLNTTLEFYNAQITSLDTVSEDLRISMLNAVGTGKAAGLQEAIEAAFSHLRATLNATEAGSPLFAGSQAELPFKPEKLADLVGLNPPDAFTNDDVLPSARLAEEVDITFGVTASALGTDLVTTFRTLAEAGAIGETPTAAQITALKDAVAQMNTALTAVRSHNAENGRKQALVETMATRADERTLLLRDVISRNEDADLGEVAIDLAQYRTMLQASYSVFSQLSGLSLVNYLR